MVGDVRARLALVAFIVSLALSALAMAFAEPANATPTPYWGYSYLNTTSPTDCLADWGLGCTQNGFNNNYAWSGMYKVDGDCVYIGWRDTSGTFYINTTVTYCSEWNGVANGFHVTRTGLGAPAYTRPFCANFYPQRSYAQCWYVSV
jgi:hypothetical protein